MPVRVSCSHPRRRPYSSRPYRVRRRTTCTSSA